MTDIAPRRNKKKAPPPIVFVFGGSVALWASIQWVLPTVRSFLFTPHNTTTTSISLGEHLLIEVNATEVKRAGVEAFARKDFDAASTQFRKALVSQPNDPESLIYLQNAEAGAQTSRIAVSVPIGSNLNVAQEILRGVAQAQAEINQRGGINGKRLQVAIADDQNDSEKAKQIATLLAQDNSILAVVGHNASNASVVAAPIYQQTGLVMVSPTSVTSSLSGAGSYIFRTVPTSHSLAEALAQYVVKTARKTKTTLCYDSQAPDNVSFKDEFAASLIKNGGQVAGVVCDVASPTFNATVMLSQAISQGADSLLLTSHIDRLEKAMEIARINRGQLALFSSPTLYTRQTLESGQADVNGLVLVAPWHPNANSDQKFSRQAESLWKGRVSWRSALAYDATQAIAAGLEQSDTRKGLQQVLRNPAFFATGTGEPIRFSPLGDRTARPLLVQVRPTATGYDFVLLQ
jgi:branched-chain amino acid transport system substrate-binding protein